MELIGKLGSNSTSKIGMLPSASKDISIKSEDQFIHIFNNNKYQMDSKVAQKIKRESLFKCQSHIYNLQRRYGVILRGVKMIWSNNKIHHYHYQSDPKLGPGIVAIRIIRCSCHSCTTMISIFWDAKIKETVYQPRYGRVYDCNYSQILGCHPNWIIMIFFMMEPMKNITNILIELLLMVML